MPNITPGDIGRFNVSEDVSSTDTLLVYNGTSCQRATPANVINAVSGSISLQVKLDDISTSGSAYVVSPIAGTISAIYSVIDGAIASGDAEITTEIDGVAVTGGAITIANSGSAAGDVDSATPTAANTVSAGSVIEMITDGGSTNTVSAVFTIVIEAS